MSLQQVELLLAGARDFSGEPLAGGKVYTYEAETVTPKATYLDAAGSSAATNPIILDANGKAQIYADGSYKFKITSSADVELFTYNNLFYSRVSSVASQWPDIFGGSSTGSSNTYVITVPLSVSSYQNGQQFKFVANHSCSGASTLNVNGLGDKTLYLANGTAVGLGNIVANTYYTVTYSSALNGFVMEGPAVNLATSTVTSAAQISDGVITNAKLANNTIERGKIAASVLRGQLGVWKADLASGGGTGQATYYEDIATAVTDLELPFDFVLTHLSISSPTNLSVSVQVNPYKNGVDAGVSATLPINTKHYSAVLSASSASFSANDELGFRVTYSASGVGMPDLYIIPWGYFT